MGLPNWITVGRIALVPVFLVLAYSGDSGLIGAFVVFVVASLSDSLDGYLARRNGTESRIGEFLDPLADKLLIGAALVVLVAVREFPIAAAVVIGAREVAVQILRIRIVRGGGVMPASRGAKWKTVTQILMVSWWLLPWESPGLAHWVLLVAALTTTLWSGLEYFAVERSREAVE